MQDATIGLPADVTFLADTGDSRSHGIFVAGLSSPNPIIVIQAARGLARTHDLSGISLITDAAGRMPSERLQWLAAMALLYYQDTDADSRAEQLIDDPNVFSALRQQVINEIGDNY